jgi:hypothetical protein
MPKVSDFLDDAKRLALSAGLSVGGYLAEIIKSGNIVYSSTTRNTKDMKIGANGTVSIRYGRRLGVRGLLIDVPVYLEANDLGVAGYAFDMRFDPNLVEYQSDSPSARFGVITHDVSQVAQGILYIEAERTLAEGNILEEGELLCTVTFLVKSTVPTDLASIPLTHYGTPGTGAGTELNKIAPIDGVMYMNYITPISMVNGAIELIAVPKPKPEVVSLPSEEQVYVRGGGSSVAEFEFDGIFLGGVSAGGSVGARIVARVDGVEVGSFPFRLQAGSNSLKGRFPLNIPEDKWSDVTYEIIVEPDPGDDSPYYILIPKHKFRVTTTTEVPRDKGNTIPPPPIIPKFIQIVSVEDAYYIELVDIPNPEKSIDIVNIIDEQYVTLFDTPDNLNVDTVNIVDEQHVNLMEMGSTTNVDTVTIVDEHFILLQGDPDIAKIVDDVVIKDYSVVLKLMLSDTTNSDPVVVTDTNNIKQSDLFLHNEADLVAVAVTHNVNQSDVFKQTETDAIVIEDSAIITFS